MTARFGRLAPMALALLFIAGPAMAMTWPFGPHRPDRPPVEAGRTAVEQARCYGRYVGFRAALYDAIQNTNSWLVSNEQAGEVDAMQAAFLARLMVERRTILQPGSDLDETAMPLDVRKAFDRGLAESLAEFNKPTNRDRRTRLLADRSAPAAQRMAKLQSDLEDTFSALRAPCVLMIDKYKANHVIVQEGPPGPTTTEQVANPAEATVWQGSQWIQVGVIERPTGAPENWDPKAQWPEETRGLSERTEILSRRGKNRRIALVGPFVDGRQIRAFCLRLKAHGGACGAAVTHALEKSQANTGTNSVAHCSRGQGCHLAAQAHLKAPPPRRGAVTLVSRQGVQDLTAGLRGRLAE